MTTVQWGFLSTSNHAIKKVIPATQASQLGQVAAIASRSAEGGQRVAAQFGIPRSYDSYEALLADPAITAIYNPLPNHLHVEWTLKALAAGKHVLCEKPLALNATDARQLAAAAATYPHLKVMEAFMYRFHPQWDIARDAIRSGVIGELRAVDAIFAYYNVNPANVRNQADIGGGALLDIGCYATSAARYLFNAEPRRVVGTIDRDPQMHTDRYDSGILDFGVGTATFTVSTQLAPYQRVIAFGTKGSIEIAIPFNAPPDQPCRVVITTDSATREEMTPAVDQYTLQADAFARAILDDTPVPTPLTDAVANMRVLDALFQSAEKQGGWVEIG